MHLFDTHVHLNDDRFADDLDQVVARARQVGIERVLTIGIDLATSQASVALAKRYPDFLSAAVAIQPNHVGEIQPGDWEGIVALSSESCVIAIGESGLDRYWDRAPFDQQEEYFARHLELSRTTKKPIIIHCREAEADVIRMLRQAFEANGPIAGIMHSYTGDALHARAALDMGLHVSFAGMITYKTAENIRETAKTIPLDRLLIETDSPYLAPVPVRGQRNEPAHVAHTARFVANLLGLTPEKLAETTTANAKRLFQV
jgi:TatD DNase family protein